MSANNRICLTEENGQWYVWHGDCFEFYYEAPQDADEFNSDKDALEHAEKLHDELEVCEGGIQIITNEEKLIGIELEIELFIEKLNKLIELKKQILGE